MSSPTEVAPLTGMVGSLNPNQSVTFSKYLMRELLKDPTNNVDAIRTRHLRTLAADPTVIDVLVQAELAECKNYEINSSRKKKIKIYDKLTVIEQNRLCDEFCEFNLDFSKELNSEPHAYARAHRKVSYEYMLNKLQITSNSKPQNGYDVVLKDVGGNPVMHHNRSDLYVHTCFPLLDNNDDFRHSRYYSHLRNYKQENLTTPQRTCHQMHLEGNRRVICHSTSQQCNVTAQNVVFLHSVYDIHLDDIALTMARARSLTGIGCFHFEPAILYKNEGLIESCQLYWKKFQRNDRIHIKFSFYDDYQEAYVHDYEVYISKIFHRRLSCFYNNKEHFYNFQLLVVKSGVAFFEIRKSICGSIPRCVTTNVVTCKELEDKLILYYYRWDTLSVGFYNDAESHLSPIRLFVSKKLYEGLVSYALVLPEGKFTVKNLMIAANSMNTREVIDGKSVNVTNRMSPHDVQHLVHAVFFEVYVMQYEASKVTSTLMKYENDVRDGADKSFLRRYLSNKFKHLTGRTPPVINVTEPLEQDCDVSRSIKDTFHDMISRLAKRGDLERKFPIIKSKSTPMFITIENEVAVVCSREKHDSGFHTFYPSDTLDPDVVRNAILEQLCIEEGRIYDDADFADVDCVSGQFKIKKNLSDGNCIYQSLIDHSVTENDVSEIRKRLVNSPHLTSLRDYQQIRRNLVNATGTVDSYGELRNFILIALEYDIRVCIHTGERCRAFGVGPTFHFNISGNHCEAMLLDYSLCDALVVSLPHDPATDCVLSDMVSVSHTEKRIKDVSDLFRREEETHKMRQGSKTAYSKCSAIALQTYDKYSPLKNCSFSSREGLVLSEVLYREYRDNTYDDVICLLRNDSILQALVKHTKAQIFSVSPPMCYISEIEFPDVIPLLSSSFDDNFLSFDNINEYRVSVNSVRRKGVEFFVGHGIEGSREEKFFDYAANTAQFSSSVLFCLAVLKRKGDAVFRVVGISDDAAVNTLLTLVESFDSVRLLRPETSRPISSEFFICCHGFKFTRKERLRRLYLDPASAEYGHSRKFSQELCGRLDAFLTNINQLVKRKAVELCRHQRFAGTPNQRASALDEFTAESTQKLLGIEVTDSVLAGGIREFFRNSMNHIRNSFSVPLDIPSFSEDVGDESDESDVCSLEYEFADDTPTEEPPPFCEVVNVVVRPLEPSQPIVEKEREKERRTLSSKAFKFVRNSFRSKSRDFPTSNDELPSLQDDPSTGITWSPKHVRFASSVRVCSVNKKEVEKEEIVRPANRSPPPAYSSLEPTAPSATNSSILKEVMQEYINYLNATYRSEVSNLAKFAKDCLSAGIPSASRVHAYTPGNFAVMDLRGNFIVPPRTKCESPYNKFFVGGKLYPFDRLSDANAEFVVVNDYCLLGFDKELADTLQSYMDIPDGFMGPEYDVGMIQAGPGCGKTTEIINTHSDFTKDKPSTVLLSTCEGRDDFCKRVIKKLKITDDKHVKVADRYYRTLASYLMNPKKNIPTQTLFIDEARMSHPGAVLFAILLSGAKFVRCLGDNLQIPFVNRTPDFTLNFMDLGNIIPIVKTLNVSYRCPLDVVARIEPMYRGISHGAEHALMSTNIKYTTCSVKKIHDERSLPSPTKVSDKQHVKYLTFTQSDKETLRIRGYDVSTVHEFQGKEHPLISVVRLNPYPQEQLFLNPSYALVAISRHTVSFVYYTKVTVDALSKLVRSYDNMPKRDVNALQHVKLGAVEPLYEVLAPAVNTCYSTFNMRSGYLYRSDCDEVHFVPKIGRYPWNPSFTPRIKTDFSFTVGNRKKVYYVVVSDNPSQTPSIRVLKKSLSPSHVVLPKNFGITSNIFQFINASSISSVFYKKSGSFISVYTTDYVDEIVPEVFELLNANALMEMPNSEIVRIDFFSPDVYHPDMIYSPSVVSLFQDFCVKFFSGCFVDQKLDSWMLHNYDLSLQSGDYSYVRIKGLDYTKKFDGLTPTLKTPMYQSRANTSRELRVAVEKRNFSIPKLSGVVDIEDVSNRMIETLFDRCINLEKFRFITSEPLFLSPNDINKWLQNQDTHIIKKIVPDFALHLRAIDSYNVAIKKNAKPQLVVDAHLTYAALQTIVYHDKDINAMFCSIFKKIKSRILYSLQHNIFLYCDMSPEDFEAKMNSLTTDCFAVFSGDDSLVTDGLYNLEVDISKYDKSQGWLALEYDCHILRAFGCPEFFVQLWYNGHVLTRLYDANTGFKCLIPFQRKSGDASTFILNTMFTLGVIAYNIPLDRLGLFPIKDYVKADKFALLFNLEVKFFNYDYPYFCSKFLLRTPSGWKFTPDPLKLLVKLGRSDIVNEQHVECYRVSFEDNVKNFSSYENCRMLSLAINERYNVEGDHSSMLASLVDLSSKENFSQLFTRCEGNVYDERTYFLDVKD
nr:putative RNA-dependent RNA polymerase [Aphis gossypii nege-like virus]